LVPGEGRSSLRVCLGSWRPRLRCDYGSVVGGCDFVNDTDKTFVPGVFVYSLDLGEGAVARVGETGFDVGDSG